MVNPSRTQGAISLHIYIPPYTKCSIFNLTEGSCQLADMTTANAYSDKPLASMLLTDQSEPITAVSELLEKLRALFAASDTGHNDRTRAIQDVLNRVKFEHGEWKDFVHFSDHKYTRMLLTLNQHFSLMLNCWKAQQSCPLHSHDHSPENTMFVKSIAGELEIQRFSDSGGKTKVSDMVMEPASPCLAISNKDLGWHTTRNPSTSAVALTLHLYTPPMLECFHSNGVAPVVYSKGATDAGVAGTEAGGAFSPTKGRAALLASAPQASLFSNFQGLVEMLSNIYETRGSESNAVIGLEIQHVLQNFEAHPKEVRDYCGSRLHDAPSARARVGLHSRFEVYVVHWKAGETSPIHHHGQSSAFLKYGRENAMDFCCS